MARRTPSFEGLTPATEAASKAHRASSRKKDTKPELALRRALFAHGLRYRVDARQLPGRPDVVFPVARVAVFVDGDFWHGHGFSERKIRLNRGTNAAYWIQKIETNIARDRRNDLELEGMGWLVLRFWESAIASGLGAVVQRISKVVSTRRAKQ